MVLRGLYSAARSGPPVAVAQGICDAHLSTLPAHVAMVALPSPHRLLRVPGLQDSSSRARSDFAQ